MKKKLLSSKIMGEILNGSVCFVLLTLLIIIHVVQKEPPFVKATLQLVKRNFGRGVIL